MSPTPILWREKLSSFQFQNSRLFDDAFVKIWGDEVWEPNESDRKAAAELHVQLVSRISTQRLAYTAGVEAAALKSLHEFFQRARDIAAAHLGCRIVDTLAWPSLHNRTGNFQTHIAAARLGEEVLRRSAARNGQVKPEQLEIARLKREMAS